MISRTITRQFKWEMEKDDQRLHSQVHRLRKRTLGDPITRRRESSQSRSSAARGFRTSWHECRKMVTVFTSAYQRSRESLLINRKIDLNSCTSYERNSELLFMYTRNKRCRSVLQESRGPPGLNADKWCISVLTEKWRGVVHGRGMENLFKGEQ